MITQERDRLLVEGPVTIGTVSALLMQSPRCSRRRKLTLPLANLPEAMQHVAQLYAVSELLQADSP